jgi:hypothetical protein
VTYNSSRCYVDNDNEIINFVVYIPTFIKRENGTYIHCWHYAALQTKILGAVTDVGPPTALIEILNGSWSNPYALVALNVADRVVAEPGVVPVIAPVEPFRVRGLIDPLTILHVIGAVPVAVRV